MDYLNIFVNIMLDAMAHMWFWLFIISLAILGRYLIMTKEIEFSGKLELNLTVSENKRKKRLLFWGRTLIAVSLIFMIIFVILCFIL